MFGILNGYHSCLYHAKVLSDNRNVYLRVFMGNLEVRESIVQKFDKTKSFTV